MWSFGQGQNKKHTVGADSISARGTCRKLHGRHLVFYLLSFIYKKDLTYALPHFR